jgi:hypothetical protein
MTSFPSSPEKLKTSDELLERFLIVSLHDLPLSATLTKFLRWSQRFGPVEVILTPEYQGPEGDGHPPVMVTAYVGGDEYQTITVADDEADLLRDILSDDLLLLAYINMGVPSPPEEKTVEP